jgi:outer membrane cobalamin receptor
VKNHEVLAGIMFRVDLVDCTMSGKRSLDNYGLYLQDLWYIAEDLSLLSGLRWDYNSEYQSPVSPRLSLTKYFTKELNISIAYGEAFRAPTISELYDVYEDPWYSFYGNPDLKPERSKRFDLTGNWRAGKHSFVVNIYRAIIKDGINYTTDYQSKINIDQIKINGLNLRMEKEITSNVTGALGYGWLERMESHRNTGTYSPSILYDYGEHHWDLTVKYKKNNFTSGVSWQMVSGHTALPDYNLLHLDFKYHITHLLSLGLAANNLLDEKYEVKSGYPMPGRSFSVGLSYNF